MAFLELHGAVVHKVLQGKWGNEFTLDHRAKVVSTAACRTICQVWEKHNLCRLLRHETYRDLIQILSDMLEVSLHDA